MTKPHHHAQLHSPADVDAALARVRAVGGRVTATKRSIVDAVFAAPDGITADDVVATLGDVDLTTAYRTLGQLEQAGVVEHVHLGHGPAIYRLVGDDTVTVVCDGCGKVTHIPLAAFADVTAQVRAAHGITLDLHHFAMSGRCDDPACQPPC